jgi:beta-glucanase (GH16 family)
MKLPPGKGVWPAFWLIGRDKTQGSPEIDVLEYYGHDTAHYRSNWHVWKSALGKADEGDGRAFDVPAGSLTDHFHTYGVDISDQYVVFYMDRKETWRINTPPSYRTCFYPLINLALGSGWPIKETPNPSFLWVDYIKVYSRTRS